MHWFAHLNHRDEILALADALPAQWRGAQRAIRRSSCSFPHVGPDPEISFHVDSEPAWADGRRYVRIVGVPLSAWRRENGGLLVKRDGAAVRVELDPGDAVMLAPDLEHSGGVNRTGSPRYSVYFRWIEEG